MAIRSLLEGNGAGLLYLYPARLVVADAALLAAKSKGLARSLTLSLRLFREKSRFATNFSRYASLTGEAGALSEAGSHDPPHPFTAIIKEPYSPKAKSRTRCAAFWIVHANKLIQLPFFPCFSFSF